MSHYISITAAERAEMLAAIGVNTTSDLFVDIPSEVRFPRLNLPDAMSEIAVRRELTRMASANAGAHSHSVFLGAGAYNHLCPAPSTASCAARSFIRHTHRTNPRSAKARCRLFLNTRV